MVPPLFTFIAQRGGIEMNEMFRAFNMGIGLVLVCAAAAEAAVRELLLAHGERDVVSMGRIVAGEPSVQYV